MDITRLASPVRSAEYTTPRTYQYGQRYGSKDTLLGRLFGGNYYDQGLLNYAEQENVRYNNQGYLNAFGNFAGDLGLKTINGIPTIMGSLTGAVKGVGNALSGGSFAQGFDDNALLNFSETVSAWGDEYFPHLQAEGFHDKSFWQQLSTPGQLATSSIETLAFATQGFGLAGLLGKANVGTRLINQLAKGRTFKQVLGELNPQNLSRIAGAVDEVTMNAFLTTNESALEAVDSRQQVISTLEEQRRNGENELTDEQIKAQADNSLTNVFWLNMLTNAATNSFFSRLVKPLYAPDLATTRANKLALQVMKDGDGVVSHLFPR